MAGWLGPEDVDRAGPRNNCPMQQAAHLLRTALADGGTRDVDDVGTADPPHQLKCQLPRHVTNRMQYNPATPAERPHAKRIRPEQSPP